MSINSCATPDRGEEPAWLTEEMAHGDAAPAISRNAMDGKSPLAEQALDLWVSIYGAEAGNLALKLMATGGVYLGGGIAPKLISQTCGSALHASLRQQGTDAALLESIPVSVITNDKIALFGAARYALAKGMQQDRTS